MSGFGSTILALTPGIHLYPIDGLLPVLVPLDMIVNRYIVARHYRRISRPHLFRSILPAMGIGVAAGSRHCRFSIHRGRFAQCIIASMNTGLKFLFLPYYFSPGYLSAWVHANP
jgi:hypothetical protein